MMNVRNQSNFLAGMLVFMLLLVGCSAGDAQRTAGSPPTPLQMPSKNFTEADVAKLGWILGSWRGTGGGVAPFYERYSFRDPRTLAVDSFEDDTLSKLTETSLFRLENGHFTNGQYALSEITDDSARFVPIVSTAKNRFVWRKETEGTWKAVLNWPSVDGKPAGERIYDMARIEQKQ